MAGYNPNQPRAPKGSEEGGRWVDAEKAAREAAGLTYSKMDVEVALALKEYWQFGIPLTKEEKEYFDTVRFPRDDMTNKEWVEEVLESQPIPWDKVEADLPSIADEPIEHLYTYFRDGSIMEKIEGKSDIVPTTPEQDELLEGNITLHNHPSGKDEGIRYARFSEGDWEHAILTKEKAMAVVSGDYLVKVEFPKGWVKKYSGSDADYVFGLGRRIKYNLDYIISSKMKDTSPSAIVSIESEKMLDATVKGMNAMGLVASWKKWR